VQVLNLPARKPLTPDEDRGRVLRSWQAACGGLCPIERRIPFAAIRNLSPQAFVALLAETLGVAGVVAGENYRFGVQCAVFLSFSALWFVHACTERALVTPSRCGA
jgi:FAD synthetase